MEIRKFIASGKLSLVGIVETKVRTENLSTIMKNTNGIMLIVSVLGLLLE